MYKPPPRPSSLLIKNAESACLEAHSNLPTAFRVDFLREAPLPNLLVRNGFGAD